MYGWMYGCMDGWMYGSMYVCMYVCVHTLSEHAYTYSYESRLRNNWQISSDMHFVCPDFTFRHECISQAGAVSSAPRIMPSGRTLGAKQHTCHGTSRHGMCARVRTTGGAECSLFVLLVDCRRLQRLSVTNFGCPFEARGRAEAAGPMLSVSCIIALIALCVGVSDSSPIRPAAPSAASGRYAFSGRWLASRPTLV